MPDLCKRDIRFLSTLSLRRATKPSKRFLTPKWISIHALLAESDRKGSEITCRLVYFYPRSPCGERRQTKQTCRAEISISIHALLAESDSFIVYSITGKYISIHALLAESDPITCCLPMPHAVFLSTLSLRRATLRPCFSRSFLSNFYPRSPCGERPNKALQKVEEVEFLSTLSLRRATHPDFRNSHGLVISIHALLAESDAGYCQVLLQYSRFLSTLSLRRATTPRLARVVPTPIFLSTLSLRRATGILQKRSHELLISIHALLAESDTALLIQPTRKPDFYPRSPCGERRARLPACFVGASISIHALLAESDRTQSASLFA